MFWWLLEGCEIDFDVFTFALDGEALEIVDI